MKNILSQSKDINLNYAPSIERIEKVEPHPNADNLQYAIINNQRIIVDKNMMEGDIVVYFPLETEIDSTYLRENNMYSTAALNADPEKKGFFTDKSRVRCIKLRGEYSMGFVAPVETLEIAYPITKNVLWNQMIGQKFDTIDGKKIAQKYVITLVVPMPNFNPQKRYQKSQKRLKRYDRLVPGQFHFHYDTEQMDMNLSHFRPDTTITMTTKIDGTSIIISNIRVYAESKGLRKLLERIGLLRKKTEFGNVFSTRRVIQNRYINSKEHSQFYNVNIHEIANEAIKKYIPEGITVYAELCGYVDGTNKCIQPKHDYGCLPGHWKLMPYRVTYTDKSGDVVEYSVPEVIKFTKQLKQDIKDLGGNPDILMEMELIYFGSAGAMYDLYEHGMDLDEWRQKWLETMRADKDWLLMEADEPLCKNKVPREGYVVRIIDDPLKRAWKLKSKAHFAKETYALDHGEQNIEDVV